MTKRVGETCSSLTVMAICVLAIGTITLAQDKPTQSLTQQTRTTIMGRVTADGMALSGVTMSDGVATAVTDLNGCYSLPVDLSSAAKLRPVLKGFAFTPSEIKLRDLKENLQTVDFLAAQTYTITGHLSLTSVCDPFANCAYVIPYAYKSDGSAPVHASTDAASCTYTLSGLTAGEYWLSACFGNYIISPAYADVTVPGDVAPQFSATDYGSCANPVRTFDGWGSVTAYGNALPGIFLTAGNGSTQLYSGTITGSNGNYVLCGIPTNGPFFYGSAVVTPQKSGYVFTPSSAVVSADPAKTNQANFTAMRLLSATASASPASGTAPLAVTLTAVAAGGNGPFTYSWTLGDGATSTSASLTHTYSSAGSYTATVRITDPATSTTPQQTATAQVTVAVSLKVTASATPPADIVGAPFNFSATASGGSAGGYSFAWNFGDGGTGGGSAITYAYNTPGTYTVTVTVIDTQGHTGSASVPVSVVAPLSVTASANPNNGTAPLSAKFSTAVTGGVSPFTYSWDFGDMSTGTGATPTHSYLAGSYIATVTVTDSRTHTASAQVPVSASLILTASVTPTSGWRVPLFVTGTATASGGYPPYTYQWNFGDSSTWLVGASVSHTYTSMGRWRGEVIAQDSVGNTASATFVVTITKLKL